MKSVCAKFRLVILATLGVWVGGIALAGPQSPRNALESLRGDLRADRKAIIAEQMQFTDKEGDAFWPIYRNYRTEAEKITDRIVELVLEYADLYPNVPERKADEMLQRYTKIEGELLGVKHKYLKKMGKVLPPSKVFRFAQLDNRFDLGTRVALAASIPILPNPQLQAVEEKR